MTCKLMFKKIIVSFSLMFFFFLSTSQVRTDGYYYRIERIKTGDTLINFLQFGNNGFVIDSLAYGSLSFLKYGLLDGINRFRYSVSNEGDDVIITLEHINLGPYDVSDCPCRSRVTMESDGFTKTAWQHKNKSWKKIKNKYLFVHFSNE